MGREEVLEESMTYPAESTWGHKEGKTQDAGQAHGMEKGDLAGGMGKASPSRS